MLLAARTGTGRPPAEREMSMKSPGNYHARLQQKPRPLAALVSTSLALLLSLAPSPSFAQWTRVSDVPAANIYSVWADGSTIVAGSDSTVFASTNGGATWTTSATVASGLLQVKAVRVHNGRLYAGTRNKGVFVSTNLGATWQDFNQGLVGGFADSQLDIMDLLVRGDSMYAATGGSGAWMRNLAAPGAWSHYGNFIEAAQAANMEGIAGSPTRLLAAAGFNGDVFTRDRQDADWSESLLFNDRLAAGLAPLSAVWTGRSWLVGSNIGVFHSAQGDSPWTYTDFGLHPTLFASFALSGGVVLTHFANGSGTGIEYSNDDGFTWQLLDAQPSIFTYGIAVLGDQLYAGRVDGLWRRSISTITAAPDPPSTRPGLNFAILGPVRDEVRFQFQLPEEGRVRIDLFDIAGRRVSTCLDESLPAGSNVARWRPRNLASGVYLARIRAFDRSEVVRMVRVR
jgi:photosystem II stability/assembly factor-like uncharacterized protein